MGDLRSVAGETLSFVVGPVERTEPEVEIASSSDNTVVTATNHGLIAGDVVEIDGHLSNPINGRWTVATAPTGTSFTLSGVSTGKTGGATGGASKITAIDLTAGSTEVRFTAKARLSDDDAAAFIAKSYGVGGGPGGITVNDPVSSRKNLATVEVAAGDTDDVLTASDYYFDVQLKEPSGRITILDRGTWKVGAAVTRA